MLVCGLQRDIGKHCEHILQTRNHKMNHEVRILAQMFLSKWWRGRGADYQLALEELQTTILSVYRQGKEAGASQQKKEREESSK